MSQQGEAHHREDAWWRQLYEADDDTGGAAEGAGATGGAGAAGTSLDDHFTSALTAIGDGPDGGSKPPPGDPTPPVPPAPPTPPTPPARLAPPAPRRITHGRAAPDRVSSMTTGPFDAPPQLLNAIRAQDFGPYKDKNLGTVPVDFLSNADTTGGNSGSPVMNKRGELVGLNFDSTYESITKDWYFDPLITRAIHVDIRYMLWVMEHVDHAQNVLKEMRILPARGSQR